MEGMRNHQISDKIYSRTNKIVDNFYVRCESKKYVSNTDELQGMELSLIEGEKISYLWRI